MLMFHVHTLSKIVVSSPGNDRLVRDPIHEADVVAHPDCDERNHQDDYEVMQVLFHRLTLRSNLREALNQELAGSQLQERLTLRCCCHSRKAKKKNAVYDQS
jgi:predicted  nucleic acid-binding Zn-ribbon protein